MPSSLKLEVDYREHKLIELLKIANNSRLDKIDLTTPNLDVGDIIINYHHITKTKEKTHYKMIIERKTVSDLMSSIKDGRYKEQKMRISSCQSEDNTKGVKCQSFYLIEGNVNTIKFRKKQNSKGIYGSWISMMFRDNIKMIRTWDLEETSVFIMRLIDRILKNPKELCNNYPSTLSTISSPLPKENTNKIELLEKDNIKKITLQLDRKTVKYKDNLTIIKNSNTNETINNTIHLKKENDALVTSSDVNIKPIKLTTTTKDRKTSVSPSELEIEKAHISMVKDSISVELEKEYLSTFSIKTKKSENLTPNVCQKLMLSVIPGMSGGISIQVLERFGSISTLIDWLKIGFNKEVKLLANSTSILRKMKKNDVTIYRCFKDNVVSASFFKEKKITELVYKTFLNTLDNVKENDIKLHLDVLYKYFVIMKKNELSELKIKVKSSAKGDSEEKERKLGPSLAEKIYSYLIIK
jgi:ERCC4-type nuclease